MCNRYGYLAPVSRLADEFSQIRIPFHWAGGAVPNLEPRDEIRPTNRAPILRPVDPADPSAGLELAELRWWLVPFFHKGAVTLLTCLSVACAESITDATSCIGYRYASSVSGSGYAFFR